MLATGVGTAVGIGRLSKPHAGDGRLFEPHAQTRSAIEVIKSPEEAIPAQASR